MIGHFTSNSYRNYSEIWNLLDWSIWQRNVNMFISPANTDWCNLLSSASYLSARFLQWKCNSVLSFWFCNFTCKRKENFSVCKFLKILNQLLPELWWCSSRESNIIDHLTIVQIRRRIVTKRNLSHRLLINRKLK